MYDSHLPKCPTHDQSYTVELGGDVHRQQCSDCDWRSHNIVEFRFPDGTRQFFVEKR